MGYDFYCEKKKKKIVKQIRKNKKIVHLPVEYNSLFLK